MKDIVDLEMLAKNGQLTDDFKCYQLYAYYLLSYLDEIFHLTELEENVQTLDSPLKPINEVNKDCYQKISPLKYFYIRNFLHLEKLSFLDTLFLKRRILKEKYLYDEKAKKLIEKSYKAVVKNHEGFDDEVVSYGNFDSGNFFAPNCAIVLGIRFDPQYEDGKNNDDQWLKQFADKKALVSILISVIEEEAKNRNIPLKVLEFDINSVQFNNDIIKSY